MGVAQDRRKRRVWMEGEGGSRTAARGAVTGMDKVWVGCHSSEWLRRRCQAENMAAAEVRI